VPFEECSLLLRQEGHHEQPPGVAQAHEGQLHPHLLASDNGDPFSPVRLRIVPGIELQRNVQLGPLFLFPPFGDVGPHRGSIASIPGGCYFSGYNTPLVFTMRGALTIRAIAGHSFSPTGGHPFSGHRKPPKRPNGT